MIDVWLDPQYVLERLHTNVSHDMLAWSVLFLKKHFRQRIGLGMKFQFSMENETDVSL